MKNKEFIELLNKYIEDEEIEKKEIEMPKKKDGTDMLLQDIKQDPLIFSDMFITVFNEFRRIFIECKSKEVTEFIEKYKPFCIKLIDLKEYKANNIEYGKSNAVRRIVSYVNENYFSLMDFFDLASEVVLDG